MKNTRWKAPLLKPLRTNYSVRGGTWDAGPALTSHSASRKAARKCGESRFSDELLLTIHTHNRCICSSTPPALTKWWWLVHSSGTRFKALGAILNRMISHPREQNRKREIEKERDEESVCNEAAMNLIFFSPPLPLPSRRLHYWTDRRKESCFLLSRYHQLYFIAIVGSRSLAPVSLTPHNSLTDEFSNKHNMILQFLFTSWDSPTRKTLERLLRSFTSFSDEVSARLSGKGVGR